MIDVGNLIAIADCYKTVAGVPRDTTVSSRVFGDSKKLGALRQGGEITVGRFNSALSWFAENWPAGAAWPEGIDRPVAADLIEPNENGGVAA